LVKRRLVLKAIDMALIASTTHFFKIPQPTQSFTPVTPLKTFCVIISPDYKLVFWEPFQKHYNLNQE